MEFVMIRKISAYAEKITLTAILAENRIRKIYIFYIEGNTSKNTKNYLKNGGFDYGKQRSKGS